MNCIDLRSDTVTRPSEGMRKAKYQAEVGDDVYCEDPTVRRLEETMAGLSGHESALFASSGTMGNLVSLLTHCGRGDAAILGAESHILFFEGGGLAAFGGILPLVADDATGLPDAAQVAAHCRPSNVHVAPARLLCVENTHNRRGGNASSPEELAGLVRVARGKGLAVHMDGARVFNAAAAWNVPLETFTKQVDSVQICLSKGLGAPVGSVICSSREFIDRARHWRKKVGGGLRQVGVLAAAGLYAIEHNAARMAEDHANAARIGEILRDGGLDVQSVRKPTNMVYFAVKNAPELASRCAGLGVLFSPADEGRVRLVTHLDVSATDAVKAAECIVREARRAG